jgi:hypothetical protein
MPGILKEISREEAKTFFKTYPQLQGMWDGLTKIPFGNLILRLNADRSIIRWGYNQVKQGHPFIIQAGSEPIGFTGYWIDPNFPDTIRMWWTGIIPPYRGKGYAEKANQELRSLLSSYEPQGIWLSESCPQGDKKRIRWFQKLGYQLWDDPDKDGLGIWFVKTVSLRIKIKD